MEKSYHTKFNIVKYILIAITIAFLFIMLGMPLILIFSEAFRKGKDAYMTAITDSNTISAIKLTLVASGLAVLFNTVFGIMMAFAVTKFKFKGRNFLITLIDLPFAISPVIAGLIYVLTFGRGGLFYNFLFKHDINIIFALPGIILATIFVTFPFVSREIIPLMIAQGTDEEEAAASMGANLWTIFSRITLPNIKWGLLYGIVLCSARAIGEFGAVSVVSGHIRGETNTLPLHVEILYNEYQFSASFAVSSILVFIAIVILIIRNIIEWKVKKEVI
ncbi:sulfate ABC transporter permease subunit CysW [Clostridium tyrobutyricum]|uniref:Sulfate transport system permease protein CysW n=1 Tax=Clostridium tyrobutyricum DIVETGP TaxID=1408889 RepID=W6N3H7_CLOTY|nr:sulfate ABC transporter permease subunit CysW [Clostridium tyrobutyricum]AND84849.1 sulfate transport system permease protein [Clostridium tyrobutyricum]ANP69430.1 sulfate ABC transporter permease subunit CysW [Clostridium tyrobutyricum]MBR9647731.1 sulfate ABC transporter permease subunit CysW [Clostridium tyrobutyricum]MBV4425564.1 sulfate ABC transporter permease subunit CysW [Clostridium tyrobutyricum]MBV4428072.1 sulfate ABC transporter permease subunit CysW [Clostridium tyrobutyricum]